MKNSKTILKEIENLKTQISDKKQKNFGRTPKTKRIINTI